MYPYSPQFGLPFCCTDRVILFFWKVLAKIFFFFFTTSLGKDCLPAGKIIFLHSAPFYIGKENSPLPAHTDLDYPSREQKMGLIYEF